MVLQPDTRPDDSALAVLGLIALRGPSTAYELKRALSRITGEFWSVAHVTPYRVTAELERSGLLTAEQERGGRRRRVYSMTDEGRCCARRVAVGADERDDGDPRSRPASPPLRRAGRSCGDSRARPRASPRLRGSARRRLTRRRRGSRAILSARRALARCGSDVRSTRPPCPSGARSPRRRTRLIRGPLARATAAAARTADWRASPVERAARRCHPAG